MYFLLDHFWNFRGRIMCWRANILWIQSTKTHLTLFLFWSWVSCPFGSFTLFMKTELKFTMIFFRLYLVQHRLLRAYFITRKDINVKLRRAMWTHIFSVADSLSIYEGLLIAFIEVKGSRTVSFIKMPGFSFLIQWFGRILFNFEFLSDRSKRAISVLSDQL